MAEEKITKETLDNLLKLSRVELAEGEREGKEKKLIKDLQNILEHFSALQTIDTKAVQIVVGGKTGENEYREDVVLEKFITTDVKEEFPETANGYLKVPAVLEHKKKK